MRENNSVDIDMVHRLFVAGEKLIVIASVMGVSEGYIQQIISKERKKNPGKWPKRQQKKTCSSCKHSDEVRGRCRECVHHNTYLKDHWEPRNGEVREKR